MNNLSTEQDKIRKKNNNPTGKGGFGDHPESRNNGGRYPRGQSPTYWMTKFLNMSVQEFRQYETTKSEKDRTVAESLAYARVNNARSKLAEFQEVMNRIEGMPNQSISGMFNVDLSNDIFDELYEKNPEATIKQIISAGQRFLANKPPKDTKRNKKKSDRQKH